MSKIPDSLTALLARMQSVMPDDVEVTDGLAETNTKAAYLMVGVDDIEGVGPQVAVDGGNQSWVNISVGAPRVEETFTIWMCLVLTTGAGSFSALMAQSITYINLIQGALKDNAHGTSTDSDGQLGTNAVPGPLAPTGWCTLTVLAFQRGNNRKGRGLVVPMRLDCFTSYSL